MRFGVFRVAAIICSLLLSAGLARAQTSTMAPGDAAVTGFSGVPATKGDQPIDLDGPSLRVIALPGGGAFGLTDATKRYTATANDIGQVFGVAIDNQPQPNIYAAATSAYGLAIFTADGRTRRGTAGADYASGQFGPANQGGGPNSIWRIDGRTGQVSLFANVETNGVNSSPASLGGLAFDPNTRQLFVADRTTGIIHRFTMDGNDQESYDHGEEGRSVARLPSVSFDPSGVADITTNAFDSQNPDTWGIAPPERSVFALAVHNGRLYYSVADGPSVWSVGIASDGSFAGDPRFETTVPPLGRGIEITAIAFDARGWMYTAERGATTGDPDFIAVADDGKSRVKRFAPNPSGDPTKGLWVQPGDDYAIGTQPQYRNADGGTALACNKNLWSTGERLLDDPSASPDSYPHVDGLQGNDLSLVEPANMPPQQSWFVSYYDDQADPQSRGHMGAIVIWNVCGGGGFSLPPPPVRGGGGGFYPPVGGGGGFSPPGGGYSCPSNTFWIGGECLLAPNCPPGTIFRGGYCLYPNCPWGYIRGRNACTRPPRTCILGTVFEGDRCVPVGCPRDLRLNRNGYCGCPDNRTYRDGHCTNRPPCDPWLFHSTNGSCHRCPDGSIPRDGKCLRRPPCDPVVTRLTNGTCKRCPDGSLQRNGVCSRKPPCDQWSLHATNGTCKHCQDGSLPRGGQCNNHPPCDTPGVAGCKPVGCRGDNCGHNNNCKPGIRGCNNTSCPNGRCGHGQGSTPNYTKPPSNCRGRHCGSTGLSNSGNNPTGCHGRRCGHGGGSTNFGNNNGCRGSHCRPSGGGSQNSSLNNFYNHNNGAGCRGRHCRPNTGSSQNSFGNNNLNNNGGGCRGRHCGLGGGNNPNGFGNNNLNNNGGGCRGRRCGQGGGNNPNGFGNNNLNNNGGCPVGEVRRGRRCVPQGR